MLTRKVLTQKDIDLEDKLDNMLGSEISEKVYALASSPKNFGKIEEKIWAMMGNSNLPYSNIEYFDGLAKEYEDVDEHDLYSACLYNCDLIYMQAIAHVLKMPIPKNSGSFMR